MQKSGCSLCKSENPLYKKIPSEKNLLIQWCALENQQSPFYVVNEVTLAGKNVFLI